MHDFGVFISISCHGSSLGMNIRGTGISPCARVKKPLSGLKHYSIKTSLGDHNVRRHNDALIQAATTILARESDTAAR